MTLDLIIDTETSGLYRTGAEPPHIVELAARLVDEENDILAELDAVIYPDGWAIEAGATAVHGITEELARMGINISYALAFLQAMTTKADRIVAHNMEFERAVIGAELRRLKADGRWWTSRVRAFRCTMELSTPMLRIPGQYGDWKFPTLTEAVNRFYPLVPWASTHRAASDLEGCHKVWRAIQRQMAAA